MCNSHPMCGLLLPELHLDRLCRFCMTRQCAKDAQTDKCTTKRSTTVEIGRINDHDLAEWLACWTQAQKGLGSNQTVHTRQTVHTHRASVHQAAKLVAALLRVARVTAGLAESNDSLPPGL